MTYPCLTDCFTRLVMCFFAVTIAACSAHMSPPRTYEWEAPKRFTLDQVFDAALQAGTQLGLQATAVDRKAGLISFRGPYGVGERALSVVIKPTGGLVAVDAAARYHAKTAFLAAASMEGSNDHEAIKSFHAALFRNLNISDPAEGNVQVKEIK